MKSVYKSLLLVLSLILVVAWTVPPAGGVFAAGNPAPSTVSLIVNNKTGQAIDLALTGPANYNWHLNTGKTPQNILPGKYKYKYQACNGTKQGTLNVEKNGRTLTLAACKRQGGGASAPIKVVVQNDTGGYITLQMVGPQTYNFSLAPGKTNIQVLKGKYTFTAWGCGGATDSGTRNVRNGLIWKFWCT